MSVTYNPYKPSEEKLTSFIIQLNNYILEQAGSTQRIGRLLPSYFDAVSSVVDGANIRTRYFGVFQNPTVQTNYVSIGRRAQTIGVKMTKGNRYEAILRMPVIVKKRNNNNVYTNTPFTQYAYIFAYNTNQVANFTYPYTGTSSGKQKRNSYTYYTDGRIEETSQSNTTGPELGYNYPSFRDLANIRASDLQTYVDKLGFTEDTVTAINNLVNSSKKTSATHIYLDVGNSTATSPIMMQGGLPVINFNADLTCVYAIDELPDDVPVFDINDTDAVLNFFNTGDDSGAIDPGYEPVEDITDISDYTSRFTTYITKGSTKGSFKMSIVAYNEEFYDRRDFLEGDYALVTSMGMFYDEDTAVNKYSQVPTYTRFYEYTDEVNMLFAKIPFEAGKYSGLFTMTFKEDKTNPSGVKVNTVYWTPEPNGTEGHSSIEGEPYGEGYIFTASSGDSLIVLYRSISLDDIKHITDDGYPERDDEGDDSSGSDTMFATGRGLKTYKVTQAGFDVINDNLWTTDWIETFRSNTIDPIKCVISSKKIPFSASGTATDKVYLANREIQMTASYVNPVKIFDAGNVRLEAIYGNFVDVTMAKVRCYLPYIGWKELPADEVMCRVGRAQVGLKSKTHTLSFKYIVDFVDGNCRCVISLDNTERWYFDGSCAVDVPVTSDSHTTAVNNAMRSGTFTTLKMVGGAISGVAGVASGNWLMAGAGAGAYMSGLMNSGDSTPLYDYNASCSPSGYIEADMNHNIMIVIEYPNAFYPSDYGHKVGYPCMLNLSLGQCTGFTKTLNVDVSGIDCTSAEKDMLKQMLDSGVYI